MAWGTAANSRWVPPLPGREPTRTSGRANVAVVDAIRMSDARASSKPPPAAGPLIAPMTGQEIFSMAAEMRSEASASGWAGSAAGCSFMSVPAQNALPAPVRITTRISGSASTRDAASASAARVARSIAFRLDGRSRMIQAMAPSRSTRSPPPASAGSLTPGRLRRPDRRSGPRTGRAGPGRSPPYVRPAAADGPGPGGRRGRRRTVDGRSRSARSPGG